MKFSFGAVAVSTLAGFLVVAGPALAQQKTEKACQSEWRANRAANQAAGITEQDYVARCRVGSAVGLPTEPANPAATNTAPSAPPAKRAAPATTTGSAPSPKPAAPTAIGLNQFATEALARVHCASDLVVWANLGSRIYHFSGNKDYGNTKDGAYMCEKEAIGQGIRAAKNEKRP
jgi:hypothetical protein